MEDKVLKIFDWAPAGLLLFQEESPGDSSQNRWVCTAANEAASQLLGIKNMLNLPLDAAFPNSVADHFSKTDLSQGIDFHVSESERWLLANGNRVDPYLSVTLSDITRQKEAMFADKKLIRLYKSLSHSLNEHETIFFDQDFNIVLTEGPARFIRLNVEGDLNGKSLSKLFEQNEFSYLSDYLGDVFGSDARNDVEREINGRMYHASLYNSRQDDEKQLIGVLLLKDVTELNHKQREINARIEQLNRSNKELETFAYVASHDLQEPLRKIKSFGERLQTKYAPVLQAEGLMYINRMADAAKRMEKLIDDLLLFSRSTRKEPHTEPVGLGLCLQNALANLEIAIEDKKAVIEMPLDWPTIEAVPSQMEQVFQNLINNSLRFSKKDLQVIIRISYKLGLGNSSPHVPLLAANKEYCFIRIEDNGIGFEQENVERIFTVFQRLHGRAEYEGSGIGLAICKKIVESHGGVIQAKGEMGVGAIFTIILPLTQE